MAQCQTNYYIDSLTYSISFCVPSCKNLIPIAYIDPTTDKFYKCTRSCPDTLPYVDMTTNVDHPICVSTCPDVAKYIDDLTYPTTKVCVSSCKNLIPTAYIKGNKCVRSCGKDDSDNILFIDLSDKDEPKCSSSCPSEFRYKDFLTNSVAPICVNSCKNLIPSAYRNKAGDACVRECESIEILDKTDPNMPKCDEECPDTA